MSIIYGGSLRSMAPTGGAARPIIGLCLRMVAFLLLAAALYVAWFHHFGRWMFFEKFDPPLDDPHYTEHLRDVYFLIYGMIGLVLGLMAGFCTEVRRAGVAALIAGLAFMSVRYKGSPEFFNPQSAEGFYGTPAMLGAAAAVLGVMAAIRFRRQGRAGNGKDSRVRNPGRLLSHVALFAGCLVCVLCILFYANGNIVRTINAIGFARTISEVMAHPGVFVDIPADVFTFWLIVVFWAALFHACVYGLCRAIPRILPPHQIP